MEDPIDSRQVAESSMVVRRVDSNRHPTHFYKWFDSTSSAGKILVLVHGLMMNGRSFDHLARMLAARGTLVIAPDLRGFGRWYFSENRERNKADYLKSLEDLQVIVADLSRDCPQVPIFCAGESLGAHLARRLAALHPEILAGLILSSPCEQPRMLSVSLVPHVCGQFLNLRKDAGAEIDLAPFAKSFLKDEPQQLHDYLSDPMSRKSLEILEIIDSLRVHATMDFDKLPGQMPVLVLRGKNDSVCSNRSIERFIQRTRTQNLTISRLDSCGHLILQGTKSDEALVDTLDQWMTQSAQKYFGEPIKPKSEN